MGKRALATILMRAIRVRETARITLRRDGEKREGRVKAGRSDMSKSGEKQISKAKKIYNVISTILVLAAFIFLAVMVSIVLYRRSHGGEANIFGYYFYDVVTDSMEPTIKAGEVIIAKKVEDANSLEVGDIITFKSPYGSFNITHRIVDIVFKEDGSVDYFKTKGDSPVAGVDDWRLSPSEVKAKFVRISPFVTGFVKFASKWYGYVVLVVIPFVIAGVFLVVGYVREVRATKTAVGSATTDENESNSDENDGLGNAGKENISRGNENDENV